MRFFYWNKACFSLEDRKTTVPSIIVSVLDYADTLYSCAAHSTLKLLDEVYHCALCFITGDKCPAHHCVVQVVLLKFKATVHQSRSLTNS